jgi:hypothetical protein
MLKLLFGCVLFLLIGVCILFFAPEFLAIALALIAVPVVLLLQAILLGIASKFARETRNTESCAVDAHESEVSALLWAYRDFRLFLARVAGYVGLFFGIVNVNWYYIALSTTLIILFWTLDRMHAGPANKLS